MPRIFDQVHLVDQVINFTDKFHVISTQLAPPLNFEMWMIQKQINLEETPGIVRWINDESGAPSDAPCTVRWMMDLVLKTVHVIKLHLALSPDTARTNFSSNNPFTINKFHIKNSLLFPILILKLSSLSKLPEPHLKPRWTPTMDVFRTKIVDIHVVHVADFFTNFCLLYDHLFCIFWGCFATTTASSTHLSQQTALK